MRRDEYDHRFGKKLHLLAKPLKIICVMKEAMPNLNMSCKCHPEVVGQHVTKGVLWFFNTSLPVCL